MKIKNNLAIAGLTLVFAGLGALEAQAVQPYSGTQCEPFTIMISIPYGGYEGAANIREKLKSEAYKMCSGHKFIIDDSSIKPYTYQVPKTGFNPQFARGIKAKVSCLNSY